MRAHGSIRPAIVVLVSAAWMLAWPATAAIAAVPPSYPREGLVGLWRGEGNATDSAGKNHGKERGNVKYAPGQFGQAFKLDGKGSHIAVPNAKALQITGSQTIAMWICPARLGLRQNPIAKAYGGEGTITLEPDGELKYYYGSSGRDGEPYAGYTTLAAKAPLAGGGKWTHIAVVRDLKKRKVQWYVNGVRAKHNTDVSAPAARIRRPIKDSYAVFASAKTSSRPLYIGKGYVRNFTGLLDEVAIWSRALGEGEIHTLFTGVADVPYVSRQTGADRVQTVGGKVLLGRITTVRYIVTTSFGRMFDLPAARVVGVAPPAKGGKGIRMVLTDGQVLAGTLAAPVTLRTADGKTESVQAADIREVGYRISASKAAQLKVSGPMVALTDGSRLAWRNDGLKLSLTTLGQKVPLPVGSVLRVQVVANRPGLHRARFANGSVLTGKLLPATPALRPLLKPDLVVKADSIRTLTWPTRPASTDGLSVVELPGGDRLYGRLADKTVTLKVAEGTSTHTVANLRGLEPGSSGGAQLKVELWDASVVTGHLAGGHVRFAVAPGLTLKLKPAQILKLTRTDITPPADWVKRVEALVKQLGADKWQQRKQAQQQLMRMPRHIVPILTKHLTDPDLEIRTRLEQIIATLEPKAGTN